MSVPNRTPTANELFMALWQQRMFAEGKARPGQSDWGSAQIVHFAKVWIDCAELARHLLELEAKASEAEETPTSWPPQN